MSSQIKLAFRQSLRLRLAFLAALLLINGVFAILGWFSLYGYGMKIFAVTISSLALSAVFVCSVICAVGAFRSLFSAPGAYLSVLTPQSALSKLFARLLAIVVPDLLLYTLAICGVTLQSFIMLGINEPNSRINYSLAMNYMNLSDCLIGILTVILLYTMLFCFIFFARAIASSIFFRMPLRNLLGFVTACTLMYIMSWLDLLLIPFGYLNVHFGLLFTVNIEYGLTAGTLLWLLLTALKTAFLFFASARLIERRINV